MQADAVLPPGFDDLAPFVDHWAAAAFQDRVDRRFAAPMAEIRQFYDAAAPRMNDMFAALDGKPIDDLPPAENRLFRLLMALAHAAQAVERHHQPRPANTMYPNTLRVLRGPSPA